MEHTWRAKEEILLEYPAKFEGTIGNIRKHMNGDIDYDFQNLIKSYSAVKYWSGESKNKLI